MVVWSPWPVYTVVSAGRSSTDFCRESMMVLKEEKERPVAPRPALEKGVTGEEDVAFWRVEHHRAG